MTKKQIGSTLDTQCDDLPQDVAFCKNCVNTKQRPKTRFNSDGIWAACEWAEIKDSSIDWDAREKELQLLCDRHRAKDGSYDVIVPGSGGKDSAFVAHQLKHRYGMNPLCITWAPHEYTGIGWANLQNFVKAGFDNVLAMPNGDLHRKLTQLSLDYVGDPFQPFIYGQKAYAYHVALKENVKLIFYGENGGVEYGGFDKYRYEPAELPEEWEHQYFKGTSVQDLVSLGVETGLIGSNEVKDEALWWYNPPAPNLIKDNGLEMHWMSYYQKWTPQENYYYAITHTNFLPNDFGRSEGTYTRMSSLDDKVDGFHFWLGYAKFGFGRATRDCITDIHRGHITREEAVTLVSRFDGEFPSRHFEHFLEYCMIDEDHFWRVANNYRRLSNVWEEKDGSWRLKVRVS